MSNFRNRVLPFLFALAGMVCLPAQAATFCVNSAATFQTALNTAMSNGQADIIRVVSGNYPLMSGLFYNSNATGSLFLGGGYAPGCASLSGQATVLDGQGSVRPLFISAQYANVSVERFDLVDGLSTNNRGGGLSIRGVDVVVDLNSFIANRADDFGGGLFATSSGELRVRNNLFLANSAAANGGAELVGSVLGGYVTGNTMVANSSDSATSAGALWIGGSAYFSISNNILWSNNTNGAVDLVANTAHVRFNNDIGSSSGSAAAGSSAGNVSVNPDFAPCEGFLCFSFVLKRSSPLVDAGENIPNGGPTSVDLLGGPRIVGGRVDIGAYEQELLFADGFQ